MARRANISVAVCIVLFLMFNMSGRSDGQQLPTKKPTTNAQSTVSIRIFSEWNNCSWGKKKSFHFLIRLFVWAHSVDFSLFINWKVHLCSEDNTLRNSNCFLDLFLISFIIYFTHSLRSFVQYCFVFENKIHIFAPQCNILYIIRL